MLILKCMFLFIGVWFSIINYGRMKFKNDISTINYLLQALGIVGFIILHFNLI